MSNIEDSRVRVWLVEGKDAGNHGWHDGEFVIAASSAKARKVFRDVRYKRGRQTHDESRAREITNCEPRVLDRYDEDLILNRKESK